MATIDQCEETGSRNRVAWRVLAGLVLTAALAALFVYLNRQPQMGGDEDVFRTVDALYTAVRMRDEARLAQCEKLLHSYREAGKLPKGSADYLDGIIAKAKSGKWEAATERLYDFMLAQRRDGVQPHHTDKPRQVAAPGKK